MSSIYPKRVEICDVGPRDGFQFEKKPIPTERKVTIIRGLLDAGLKRIQVTSFVHPKWVPQMADAADVFLALSDLQDENILSVLALNEKGVERAVSAGARHVDLSIATNESHSQANANMSVSQGVEVARRMVQMVTDEGLQPQLGLQTVFGHDEPGDTSLEFVSELVDEFSGLSISSISLADTTGMANPMLVTGYLEKLLSKANGVPLVLHLHDTRGLGMANVEAALRAGVTRFDTSFGGLGGCPFIPGATGNIATEDTVYLCESLGVETGVDRSKVSRISLDYEEFRGFPLTGKLYKLS